MTNSHSQGLIFSNHAKLTARHALLEKAVRDYFIAYEASLAAGGNKIMDEKDKQRAALKAMEAEKKLKEMVKEEGKKEEGKKAEGKK